jgi:hypothetical protein
VRAQKRQLPGLPDPVYPAKGVFPPGYVNPDESVRALARWVCFRATS